MKTVKRALLGAAIVLVATEALAAGNANFIIGRRTLQDDAVRTFDLDKQSVLGVNVDFGGTDWPVQLMAGAHLSAREEDLDGEDIAVAVAEFSFGAAWIAPGDRKVRPYVGGGMSIVGMALDTEDGEVFDDETDQSMGYYLNGGVFFRLGSRFNIGVDARFLRGTDIELGDAPFTIDTNGDYNQLGMILGFGW